MPVSRSTASPLMTEADGRLRPYVFHGVHLSTSGTHALGDCPFCGRDAKFSVEIASGLWRCFVCGAGTDAGGGNGLVFTRLIHENAAAANVANGKAFQGAVAADRRLLSADTPAAWGVCQSRDGLWLVPGYAADGRLDQVYRRIRILEKDKWVWRLLPTPGIWPEGKVHALHLPAGDFDPSCETIYVCEGPWDGMALWEVARDSSIAPCQVVAVPGCNVWRDEWTELCRGKHVVLMFDSDHPRRYTPGGRESRAGYDGMVRVAKRLSGAAASVRWLKWGEEGYDPSKPSGWDVRDELTGGSVSLSDRRPMLDGLLAKIEDAPREWFNPTSAVVAVNGHSHAASVEALPCSRWAECEESWDAARGGALRWRQDLSDALAVLLAVCASTHQPGNQLFLDLIGSPGSAKTTLCRGLLVSSHCIHLENATKLISGYKKPGDDSKDCSFLARANNKTWITCEFDVLASSPQYRDLMGKVRRIFDGETSATYGNSDEDRVYSALRTPWIRAGTLKMVDHDQSQLGDRFLRFYISDPDNEEKREITKCAIRSERAAIMECVNSTSGSILDLKTRRAHALTGGYVDWLRANIEDELPKIEMPEFAEDFFIDLAEFSADMRARPIWEERYKSPSEADECKELPTRLARQFVRIANCLAVVLNKFSIDSEVLRIVRKVALDTASGHSLKMVYWMCSHNPRAEGLLHQDCGGLTSMVMENWSGMDKERLHRYLGFLCKIDVMERHEVKQAGTMWKLTPRVYELYLRVMKG